MQKFTNHMHQMTNKHNKPTFKISNAKRSQDLLIDKCYSLLASPKGVA